MILRRRGFSSISSRSVGSLNNQCSEAGAFTDWRSKGDIAALAIILFGYLVLLFSMFVEYVRSKKRGIPNKTLRWFPWGTAVFLIISYYVVNIASLVLFNCSVIAPLDELRALRGFSLTLDVLGDASRMLLLSVIVFYLVPSLLYHSGKLASNMIKLSLGVVYGLTFVFFVIFQIMTGVSFFVEQYIRALGGVEATFGIFYLICAVAGSFFMILSLSKLRHHEHARSLRLFIPLLVMSFCFLCLKDVITIFIFDVALLNYLDLNRAGAFASFIVSVALEASSFAAVFCIGRTVNRVDFYHAQSLSKEDNHQRAPPIESLRY